MLIYCILNIVSPKYHDHKHSEKKADPKDKRLLEGKESLNDKVKNKVEEVKQSREMLEFETWLLIFATLSMGFRAINQLKIF